MCLEMELGLADGCKLEGRVVTTNEEIIDGVGVACAEGLRVEVDGRTQTPLLHTPCG